MLFSTGRITERNMADVLIFTGNEPPRLLQITVLKKSISYVCPDKISREMPVDIIFATFLNGKSGAVLVAADRAVTRREIIEAHLTLIAEPVLAGRHRARRGQGLPRSART